MSMELDNSFTVPVPPDQAWDVLLDVERIAPCMPGATVDEFDGDVVNGRIKVKVGPVSLTYRGTAKFTERDPEAHVVVMEASGKETRGAGTASATVRAALAPDDSGHATQVTMHTTMNVTGRPAQFGRGVMVEVGGKLVDQFAQNLGQLIAGGSDDSARGRAAGRRGCSGPGRYGTCGGSPDAPVSSAPGTPAACRWHATRRPRPARSTAPPSQAAAGPALGWHSGDARPLPPGLRPAAAAGVSRLARHMVRRFTGEPVRRAWTDPGNASAARRLGSPGQAFLVLTAGPERSGVPVLRPAHDDGAAGHRADVGQAGLPGPVRQPTRAGPTGTRCVAGAWHIDTGMAALLILLTVVDEGLGALYFGIVPEAVQPFREAFGVPDDHEPIGAIAIGHNAETAPRDLRSRRRPAQDVVHYGRW